MAFLNPGWIILVCDQNRSWILSVQCIEGGFPVVRRNRGRIPIRGNHSPEQEQSFFLVSRIVQAALCGPKKSWVIPVGINQVMDITNQPVRRSTRIWLNMESYFDSIVICNIQNPGQDLVVYPHLPHQEVMIRPIPDSRIQAKCWASTTGSELLYGPNRGK